MPNEPQTPGGSNPTPDTPPGRKYWIDEYGNVHGIIMTVEVDPANVHVFNEKAINYPPGTRREDLKG